MKQILYFTAEWCGPCKTVRPLMESVQSQIPIRFIDVDRDKSAVEKYGVRNVPTAIMIDQNGNMLSRLVGTNITKDAVVNMYNK